VVGTYEGKGWGGSGPNPFFFPSSVTSVPSVVKPLASVL